MGYGHHLPGGIERARRRAPLARMCDGSHGQTSALRSPTATGEPVRKRKVTYPPAKTANRPAPASGLPTDAPYVRPTVATIDLTAGKGRAGLAVGGKVRDRKSVV